MKNKSNKSRQVLAISGVVLLVGLYIAALVLSLIKNDFAQKMLVVALAGTLFIPILLYFILMFMKLSAKKSEAEEPQYAAPSEDPFTEEDVNENEQDN